LLRLDESWVLGPIDEARQVEVVMVRPARGLLADRGNATQRVDRAARDVEDDVVAAARDPQHGVVLGRRHHEALDPHGVDVEAGRVGRRVLRGKFAPQLGPETGHEIDAAHRRPRLAQRGNRGGESSRIAGSVEFNVGVRGSA